MQTINKSEIIDRCSAVLAAEGDKGELSIYDAETRAAIAAGKKEFFVVDYYMRKELLAANLSGTQKLLLINDALVPCVTNIDKAKLPQGNYFAMGACALSYGFSATAGIPAGVRYSNSEYLNTHPTKFVNSEFSFLVGDKPILNKIRTKKFLSASFAEYGVEANEENALVLPQPKIIPSNKILQANLEFAGDATAVPAGSHYFEFRMIGVELRDRV